MQRLSFIAVSLLICADPSSAKDALLNGLWMETANYPASSVLRFEKSGKALVGKYRQVSVPQKHWGFSIGETVIRGEMQGNKFVGQVLLKLSKDFLAGCPNLDAGWAPIELTLIEPGKFYGRWRQTYFSEENPCQAVGHTWQLYGLEQLKLN